MGFAQNLIQCESALQVNKNKSQAKHLETSTTISMDRHNWYFILFASNGISCTSKNSLNIHFTESALKEGSEEEKELCKNVKRIIKVIVGLLKDRVDVERKLVMKK